MSIIRWSPMLDPFDEMAEVMNRLPAISGQSKAFMPAMDIYQTPESVVVESPLVGVNPENVKVSVENGILTVQGEGRKEREVEEKNYYRKEIRRGSFYRSIPLPTRVLGDKASAIAEEGILKISVPKASESKPKSIKIKTKK